MRAIMVSRNGGPDVLALAELPDPVPGPGDRFGWAWPGVLGGYAERVAVPAQWAVPLPPQVGPSTAAAVPADTPGRYVQSRQKGRDWPGRWPQI